MQFADLKTTFYSDAKEVMLLALLTYFLSFVATRSPVLQSRCQYLCVRHFLWRKYLIDP